MTLRHTTICCLALPALVMASGCLDDRCKDKSAQVELTVTFNGTDGAQRLEFETRVVAPGVAGEPSNHPYITTRMGSLPFPSLEDGKATFLLDPGQYVHNLPEGEHATFTVILRVFGEKAGVPEALLAEGRWEKSISPTGCYIDAAMTVGTQRTCSHKQEGDPCVASAGIAHAVCMPDGAGGLDCETSTCGDGFTDRRNGEICDPDHSDPSLGCDYNCLPLPVVLRVDPEVTADGTRLLSGEKVTISHSTTLDGNFYTVGIATGATDLAGSILIADLDGDGLDELALGLPGAPAPGSSGPDADKTGVVYVEDWYINSDESLGTATQGMYLFGGPDTDQDAQGSWFGASLAAGDVDGNGTMDLAIGAPRLTGMGSDSEQLGGLYVVFSGEDVGYITAGKTDQSLSMSASTQSFYQSFHGAQGVIAGQLGDHLGYAVVMADLNLDGYTDLAVSAPHRKRASIDSHGAVYVLRGGDDFWGGGEGKPDNVGIQDAANVEIDTWTTNSRLGVSLATGDVNGDGYPDLIMGMTANQTDFEGGVTVLFGGEDVLPPGGRDTLHAHPDPAAGLLTLAPSAGHALAGLGGTVTAVDLDGDGRAEVVAALGRPGSGAGDPYSVAIISGAFFDREQNAGSALPGAGDFTVVEGPADSRFGLVLTTVDVSGDRRPDLLVSAPWADDDDNAIADDRAGAVYALLSTPRSNLWGQAHLSIEDLLQWDPGNHGNIPVPLILLQGVTTDGQLGAATGGSSHLAQIRHEPECRNAYTYVLQPGYSHMNSNPYSGRIYTYFLPAALPCESHAVCEVLCN